MLQTKLLLESRARSLSSKIAGKYCGCNASDIKLIIKETEKH
jgi:hypothetical protein